MTDPMPAPVVVEVPPSPEHAHILRSVAASVATRLDLPLDAIEDLKIAVDEAVAHLLTTGGSVLRMEVLELPGGVQVTASTDASEARWPPDGFEGSLTWQVLTGLTDDASFEHDGGPVLRFTKRAPADG